MDRLGMAGMLPYLAILGQNWSSWNSSSKSTGRDSLLDSCWSPWLGAWRGLVLSILCQRTKKSRKSKSGAQSQSQGKASDGRSYLMWRRNPVWWSSFFNRLCKNDRKVMHDPWWPSQCGQEWVCCDLGISMWKVRTCDLPKAQEKAKAKAKPKVKASAKAGTMYI